MVNQSDASEKEEVFLHPHKLDCNIYVAPKLHLYTEKSLNDVTK